MTRHNTPWGARQLLAWCLHPSEFDAVLGDLEELYTTTRTREGRFRANVWFWLQVLRSAPRFLISTTAWRTTMLANYLKLALRHLRKHQVYGAINLAGLSLGLALCILILLFVRDELTYDRFHAGHEFVFQVQEQVYEADGKLKDWNSNGPLPLGAALEDGAPGIESYTRIWDENTFIRVGMQVYEEASLRVDPEFLDVFPFPLLEGSPKNAISGDGVVLTRRAADRLVGPGSALGKSIEVRLANEYSTYVITGVVADPPANSTIQFDALLPIEPWIAARFPDRRDAFNMSLVETWIRTREDIDRRALSDGLRAVHASVRPETHTSLRERTAYQPGVTPAAFYAMPIADVHLNVASDPRYSYMLSGLALAILLIACINFMTMAIGRSLSRSTEVGIRKVVGAVRTQLIGQFWGEAVMVVILSSILGLIGAWAALPWFNDLTGKDLQLALASDWSVGAGIVGLMLITGLIAGSYPALVLSSFKPIDVLKSTLRVSGANWFTRGLVALQFALSVSFIIGTLVMKQQTDYLRERDLGFDSEQVVLVKLNGLDGPMTAARFRAELASSPRIAGVTLAASAIGYRGSSGMRFMYQGERHTVDMLSVDHSFLSEMGIPITLGRDFDPARPADSTGAIIVNEALVRDFEIVDPLGKSIPGTGESMAGLTIIGVTEDFNYQSLYQEVGPLMMAIQDFWGFNYMYVRLAPGQVDAGLTDLRQTWSQVTTDVPFVFEFLDDRMARVYAQDLRWERIINVASLCAIFLALLGLFGLTAIAVRGRTREIGIRKVLGASRGGLVALVARDYLVLILVGAALAVPAAWAGLDRWLSGFAYRVELGPGAFVVGILLVLLAGLGAVAAQCLRAVSTDPARALRSE